MAIVKNNSARLYNLKCVGKTGNRVVVRLIPGLNSVDDKVWKNFVNGKTIDPYVKTLVDEGYIELSKKPSKSEVVSEAITKTEPIPALVASDKETLDVDLEDTDLDLE